MTTPLPSRDFSNGVPLRARIANRLAKSVPTAPVRLAPPTPLVSFTFDDAPSCACTRGADLLDAFGAKGTFYVSGGLIGAQAQYWRLADEAVLAALHARDHEIGCHTFSHAFLPDLGAVAVAADLRANRDRLRSAVPGLELESFAYPYGFGTLAAKRVLRAHCATSRSIAPGLNLGRADAHYLRANPLIERRLDEADIARLMDEALARNGWLIFYSHDVTDDPSPYGCSPALLRAALRAAAERQIPCVSVAEGFRRAVRRPARIGHAEISLAS